jgi:peptidoglycan hydrolase-like protein with peptidoglycan-binding domain
MERRTWPRHAAAAMACGTAALAFATSAQASIPPPEGGVSKPKVNMARVLVAAQLDQYRPSNGTTPGAVKSVKRIQRRLRRKGFTVALDGNFGAQTVRAYAAWQRRLGFSGLNASGMPGKTSLRKLVGRRFEVTHIVNPGARKVYSGVTLNVRTIRMLKAAGHRLRANCVLDPTKGSYTGPDNASEATHAGGGAVDLSVRTLCGKRIRRVVKSLRAVGFAAWYRNWTDNQHIHAVAISDPDMATETAFPGWFDMREQVVDWAQGKNGLHTAVTGPMTRPLMTWERYKRTH